MKCVYCKKETSKDEPTFTDLMAYLIRSQYEPVALILGKKRLKEMCRGQMCFMCLDYPSWTEHQKPVSMTTELAERLRKDSWLNKVRWKLYEMKRMSYLK